MSELKVFRVLSGEEILAEVQDDGTLLNPVYIVPRPQENGNISLAYQPALYFAKEDKIEGGINPALVLFSYTPDDEIAAKHREFFSKIITPNTGIAKVAPKIAQK